MMYRLLNIQLRSDRSQSCSRSDGCCAQSRYDCQLQPGTHLEAAILLHIPLLDAALPSSATASSADIHLAQ